MNNLMIQIKGKMQYDLLIISAFSEKGKNKEKEKLDIGHWPSGLSSQAKKLSSFKNFSGGYQKTFLFPGKNGAMVLALGLGEKVRLNSEKIRVALSSCFANLKSSSYQTIFWDIESFDVLNDLEKLTLMIHEAFAMTQYQFLLYKKEDKSAKIKHTLYFSQDKNRKNLQQAFYKGGLIAENVNLARDFISEPPNVLTSVEFADRLEADAKKLSSIKVKVLKKKEIQKEKMNLLLSVNQGSAFEPRVVHLSYTPENCDSNTKHIALIGKGLTFDSGGYSLKPATSMTGMKFDMAGAATVYSAFKNAVQLKSPYKISCFLGITDNMVAPFANTPDMIIRGRSGKTVEILNTDAEGRLVLADVIDYACDFKPDEIIDVATLTGACVRALGHVVGLMGNDDDFIRAIIKESENQSERTWQLPIFDEYRDDIKSTIAEIKNIGGSGYAGAQTAAAFLEHFVKKPAKWVHLDIAGVDTATHLPYCPKGSPTGLMIRTLTGYLLNAGESKDSSQ